MNDFDPGPGWRESNGIPDGVEGIMLFPAGKQRTPRRTWVREEPVPPLPTEPYSKILARMRQDGSEREYELRPTMKWIASQDDPATTPRLIGPELTRLITGFEVLVSPPMTNDGYSREWDRVRRDTAKAVLDRVRDEYSDDDPVLRAIAREFGVEVSS